MRKLWKHPQLVDAQATLFGKTIAQTNDEQKLHDEIVMTEKDLEKLGHFQKCETCRMDLCLSVERYLGRGAPWYLDIMNDDGYLTDKHKPKLRQFKVGRSVEDTLKFVDARITWAQPIIASALKEKQEQLKLITEAKAF
jgi:hypothetical protein